MQGKITSIQLWVQRGFLMCSCCAGSERGARMMVIVK